MAISTQKLLPSANVEAKIAKISANKISADKISVFGKKGKTFEIKTKIIEIDKILKGTLAADKKDLSDKKKKTEKSKREKTEEKLEQKTEKKKRQKKSLQLPKMGFFDRIKNFIGTTLLGFITVRLVEFLPQLESLLPKIADTLEWLSDFAIGFLDGVGGFLEWGYKIYDDSRNWIGENLGDDVLKKFDEFSGLLNKVFNLAIVASMLSIGGSKKSGGKLGKVDPKTKPSGKVKPEMKPTGPRGAARKMQIKHGHAARGIYENAIDNGKSVKQANAAVDRALKKGQIVSKPQTGSLGGTDKGSKIVGRGLKKIPARLSTKILGKAGLKVVKGIFGKIPIMGPIIIAVASLLSGEPVGQALFKGVGAALGGLLGTFIPIPVIGTLLGETIGVFVGDLLFELIRPGGGPEKAGQKFVDAMKSIFETTKTVGKYLENSFNRFIDSVPKQKIPFTNKETPIPDIGWMINPLNLLEKLNLLRKAFFPPKEGVKEEPFDFGKMLFGSVPLSLDESGEGVSSAAGSSYGANVSTKSATGTNVNVSTKSATGTNVSVGSKLAGELGRFLNERGLRWGSGVSEHPEHGGVVGRHSPNSYHYKEQGYRAIDIGGWGPKRYKREGMSGTDDQTKILAGIAEWNKKKGVSPVEFLHEGNEPYGHNDHVHVAYAKGGFVDGLTHAMLGEKGREFVLDADSTKALEDNVPGFLSALNKADYSGAMVVLRNYASYEGNQVKVIPVPVPVGSSSATQRQGSFMTSMSSGVVVMKETDWKESLYMGG